MQIGSWGFRKKAYDKLIYNQYASPQELGLSLCQYIVHNDISYMNEVFDNLIEVTEEYPTINQLKLVNKITGLNFPQFYSWKRIIFDYLYRCSKNRYLEKDFFPFFFNDNKAINDSFTCDWAYIINLDTNVLEIYKGFNENPMANGRYAIRSIRKKTIVYFGCELIKTIPLKLIKKMPIEDLWNIMYDIENNR